MLLVAAAVLAVFVLVIAASQIQRRRGGSRRPAPRPLTDREICRDLLIWSVVVALAGAGLAVQRRDMGQRATEAQVASIFNVVRITGAPGAEEAGGELYLADDPMLVDTGCNPPAEAGWQLVGGHLLLEHRLDPAPATCPRALVANVILDVLNRQPAVVITKETQPRHLQLRSGGVRIYLVQVPRDQLDERSDVGTSGLSARSSSTAVAGTDRGMLVGW